MHEYLRIAKKVITHGIRKKNRTGTDHIGYIGDMAEYYMYEGFPIVTTKYVPFKMVVGEMLGFLRAYNNAADFRHLGVSVWDKNANENETWLNNRHRRGTDDLGEIYGVQARFWKCTDGSHIDQFKRVLSDLMEGVDNRREIVSHWNPEALSRMALPPCHLLYQFGIHGDRLDLSMYQRSCDVPLGVPFNIAGYSWLLHVVAHLCKLRPGKFTHFMHDIHAYEDQLELLRGQIDRLPYPRPRLRINPEIKTLEDLETWVTPEDFVLEGYKHHPRIAFPFAT